MLGQLGGAFNQLFDVHPHPAITVGLLVLAGITWGVGRGFVRYEALAEAYKQA